MDRTALHDFLLAQSRRVHLMGIGGVAMSGLAHVLAQLGHAITGCDKAESAAVARLRSAGVPVTRGHGPDHLAGVDVLVYTSAIPEENPELVSARQRGIPTVKRAVLQGALTLRKKTIAVAGTHGKTTTTGMIAYAMRHAGLDPTYMVGGDMIDFFTSYHWSNSPWAVVEADEFDRAFLELTPTVTVINAIEPDHLDFYGTTANLLEAFRQLTTQTQPEGWIVVNADDPACRELALQSKRQVRTWSLQGAADWTCTVLNNREHTGYTARVRGFREQEYALALAVPGLHNVRNALACLAALECIGVASEVVVAALGTFRGIRRRFEVRGCVGGVTLVDDYAHHPTEVQASLAAARDWHHGRIVAVYQPHLRSRTEHLFPQFAAAFAEADVLVLMEVYHPEGRYDPSTISSRELLQAIQGPRSLLYAADHAAALGHVLRIVQPGDLILTMGAGDVTALCEPLLAGLEEYFAGRVRSVQ